MNGACRILTMVMALTITISAAAAGDTVYLTDKFQVGLHENKSLDSTIIKTIPSGTALELIKREKNFTFVRDSQGVSGWIDNSYLVSNPPAGAGTGELQAERDSLEKQLEEANRQITHLQGSLSEAGAKDQSNLRQQLNSERIKTGELQIKVAELKKRLGENSDTESLYQQIEDLKEKNKTLEIQLTGAQNQAAASRPDKQPEGNPGGFLKQDWKRSLLYILMYILIGAVLGVYIMDFYIRRRHGGFRV